MKNTQLQKTLEDLGLTENEAQVYLSSLSLGPATVLQIAKTAEVRRTTVYTLIESLKNKGLMYTEPKGFKKLYTAEHPNKLETLLNEKKDRLQKLFPEFEALYNLKGAESTIKYYEGLESIKTIYDTMLKELRPGDNYLVISNLQKFFDMDREYFDPYLKKRIKSPIKSRLISTDSEQAQYMKRYAQNMNHEIKILPKDTDLSVDVMIVPHKVTIFNLDQPLSAVSTENPAMVKMHKEIFEILWKSLPSE